MDMPEERRSYFKYWGKARPDLPEDAEFHCLPFHCLDVAAVGRLYLQRHRALLNWFADALTLPTAPALDWLTFWLALHDLGKFATSFQNQRSDLLLRLQGRSSNKAYSGTRHDSLGELLWRMHLLGRADVLHLGPQANRFASRLAPWVYAVTGHHGEPPDAAHAFIGAHFDARDETAAAAFVAEIRRLSPPDTVLERLKELPAKEAIQLGSGCSWWFAGIAVLADWLGSNTAYFPYLTEPCEIPEYWQAKATPQAERALAASGVLPQPIAMGNKLQDLFTRERIPALTPMQTWADELIAPSGPQLYILEDVTGAGKTEAALTLAYRLMEAGQADGLFVGLPTMATANAMYARVAAVAKRLFDPGAQPSVVLAHGRRELVPVFRHSVLARDHAEVDPNQIDETASARCTAWLGDHNKKSLLASVGVGTIDQALLAVLHAKHQSLRLLGLFRKVLVVDEVHACDDYMQELLEGLLQFHAAGGGGAILVSATLTSAMKQKLAVAFSRGRGWPTPVLRDSGYPLVTCLDATGAREHALATRLDVQRRIAVDYRSDPELVLGEIRTALRAGRCVCWVRNTVADAIQAWDQLRSEMQPDRCTLFHARFALGDRLAIEDRLLCAFGPQGGAIQRAGRLVIATQVVEQSLDVDFDLLVSDLAPIDRLIQRAGRLQRHTRAVDGTARPGTDERGGARLIVHGPECSDEPKPDWVSAFFPRGAAVYPHAGQLWLTARQLVARGRFSMPEDARALIEGVFSTDAHIPDGLRSRSNEAEGVAWANTNIAYASRLKIETGYARGHSGAWLSDDAAPAMASEDGWDLGAATRLGETTVTVRIARWQDGSCLPWHEGEDAWELSSVRVIARHIKDAVIDTAHYEAFEAARATLPDEGKWSILLPFTSAGNGIWCAQARDLRGKLRHWQYDHEAGLREAPEIPEAAHSKESVR